MAELIHCRELGLDLDADRHLATRNGIKIEFGGRCREWEILLKLARRHDGYFRINDLIAEVWNDDKLAFNGVENGTVYSAVANLRKKLRLLGLTIKFTKGLGYRLEEIAKNFGPMQSSTVSASADFR